MDDERQRKLEAGREKLEAYKKKKKHTKRRSSSSQSDTSFSLTPPLPPDNVGALSDSSIISEHLNSNSDSVENDRSFQEIEISNVPIDFILSSDDDVINSLNLLESFDKTNKNAANNVQSILDEILRSDQFQSDSEHTLHQSEDILDSNENSFNLFKDVNLNDSLIHEYVNRNTKSNSSSLNTVNLNVTPAVDKTVVKAKQMEELLNTKDMTIAVLTAELESLRELTSSNQSTLSLNTSTTDYKQYHDEFQNKIVEFQNALSHRDSVIQQLTEALQQSVINREQLQEQSEYFSKEIVGLQKQLAETSAIIAQHKWDVSDSIRSIKDNSIQTDSLPSQILQEEVVIVKKNQDWDGKMLITTLEPQYLKLEATLSTSQITILNELKKCIDLYVQQKIDEFQNAHQNELKILEDKFETEKVDHEAETTRLRELLASIECDSTDIVTLRQELEAKHAKEMEELRTYFEQKCADVEKNYSEEVFSQQSRKMSGSSSSSEASDFIFSNCPGSGPAGDSRQVIFDTSKIDPTKRDLQGLTKDDLVKLKTDLAQILDDLNKYNMNSISKQDVLALGSQLTKYDLRCLLKYDLSAIKMEMQNKYHAELEILREDYENRIDTLNVEYESRLQKTEAKYIEQMETLKFELEEATRNAEMNVTTAVQEVMLVANTVEDAEWPAELLQIRNRFTEKYEKQIAELEEKHQAEVSKLKEEHLKIFNGALERARRKSLKDDSLNQTEMDIIKERDTFKKTTTLLRQLVGELMKYVNECEDELNNTLIEQLLKQGFDKSLAELETDTNLNESSVSTCSDSATNSNKKRVHFAPKFDEIMATIDNSVPSSVDSSISVELKNELGACLNRLKADANAILALSLSFAPKNGNDEKDAPEKLTSLQDRVISLTKQLIVEGKVKKDLSDELEDAKQLIENLEAERTNLEGQIEQFIAKQNILEGDLHKAHEKISELIENGHKEIISEGYGENLRMRSHSLGDRIATLSELQERARSMVAECASSPNHPLLQLVEELCREGDRITEQAKNDHEDLQQQQIEAADKKLRATCQFLEEQAAEREQERDEAQKEIASLREQLRERERDRKSCERINSEEEDLESVNVCCRNFKNSVVNTIEHLEQQMREMSKLSEENDAKYNEVEAEKNEAIEKIFVLRDIIRDLESQIEVKTENETGLKVLVVQLEDVVKQQNKTNEELSQHLSLAKSVSEVQQLQQHVEQLQDEVQRLRLNSEYVGSEGALKQIKTQLNEFEANIDKWTRNLEALHSAISATSCSSPSEDMSIRDQIRPRTPSALEECDVPLQQLARLKEKLVKHSRAEDAAVKRIHDLEMELDGIKHDFDEIQNERDILQDQVSEQLVLISSLQMRLDDQRLRADQVQKQTNTSLEVRIYDLENEIKSLMEIISVRDKTVKHLNKTIEETRKRLLDQEQELSAKQEDKVVLELQRELEKLRAENASLLVKINNDAQNAQVLPNLVDNILADKNKDIEMLREKLNKTQSELDGYLSLNLDHEQLKTLSKLQSPERAFADILSLIDLDAPDTMRKAVKGAESLSNSVNIPQYKRNADETTFIGGTETIFPQELSSIEKIGRSNIHYSLEMPLTKPNSTEKRVHFDDSIYNITIEKLQSEILELKNELFTRDEMLKEYTERVTIFSELEDNIQKLQEKLDFTENALQQATGTFEKEQDALRLELAEKKMHLMEKEKKLELSEQDAGRKDQMYINLAKEKRELEKTLKQFQDNDHEIEDLKTQLNELGNTSDRMKRMETELHAKQDELQTLQEAYREVQRECDGYKVKIKERDELNAKLEKDLKNKESQLVSLTAAVENKNVEVEMLKSNMKKENERILAEFETNLKDLKTLLVNKETEIEILNEDAQRYQEDISKLENQLKTTKRTMESEHELKLAQRMRENAAKDLQIVKLSTDIDDCNREINHLQVLLNEKDRIVSVMSDDSKSLRSNLETIQSKIQESGNVVDLKRRLEDEQRLNAALREELRTLKCTTVDENKPIDMTASIEEIEVRKQLDYSAHLDSSILSALGNGDNENLNGAQRSKHVELQEIKQKFEKEREKVDQLEKELKTEKQNSNTIQLEDAHMLEQLRIRLEAALESGIEFEKLLVAEKRVRENLEVKVEQLKSRLSHLNSAENSKTEVTEYKSLPTLESQEFMRLRKDLPILQEENSKLKVDVKNLKKAKSESEATLKYTKDMLQLKNDEVGKLEKQIAGMRKSEEKWMASKAELEQKTREIENSRVLIGEMEQEALEMRKQIESLNENLQKGVEREKKLLESATEAQMKQTVPDKFLNKMKDLSNLVKEHIKDNKQMTETVEKLTNERLILQDRIKELEELNHIKLPFDDPVERANHLFARYLRAESYRKALVWQKRYLVTLLASYQTYPLFSRELPIPFTCTPIVNKPARSSGITRFKAVASAVIAAIRMQFLVQRWHSGKRGFVLSYRKRSPKSTQHITPPSTAHFQVGQPVSNQNFPIQQQVLAQTNSNLNRFRSIDVENNPVFQQRSELRRSTTPTSPVDLGPWSGATPPSRDPKVRAREFETVRPQSGSSTSNEDYIPLQAPYLLSRYIERFDQIQQRLGMAMDKHST